MVRNICLFACLIYQVLSPQGLKLCSQQSSGLQITWMLQIVSSLIASNYGFITL
uniref:Uncharacterized protein n=1 Tax=Rhizophora mucronata TaxID=61149 RepID=A0A2P2QQD6_RHIMU